MSYRVCTKCGAEKPFTSFHKHKQCKNGVNSVCKTCRKSTSKAQWAAVPEERKILNRAKTRANRKGLPFDLSIEDIVIPERCPVLGITMDTPSIDRHVPERGYVKENIVIMSNRANILKNNGSLEEFKMLVKYLTEKI